MGELTIARTGEPWLLEKEAFFFAGVGVGVRPPREATIRWKVAGGRPFLATGLPSRVKLDLGSASSLFSVDFRIFLLCL